MRAFVTSIGERTTELCCWQLERLGYSVVLLDAMESWHEKYSQFIHAAAGPCLRLDADVIVNQALRESIDQNKNTFEVLGASMAQWKTYDLYRNGLGTTSPVYYSADALEAIRCNLGKIDKNRPETWAWRLPEINHKTVTINEVVGFHGFYQYVDAIVRHKVNKVARKQDHLYDWELVDKIQELYG